MYNENKCIAFYSRSEDGVSYRYDNLKTKNATSRTLRSGREVGMTKFTGHIYRHIFPKLKQVEFHVDIFSRTGYCDHHTLRWGKALRDNLFDLWLSMDRSEEALCGRTWEIVIHSAGPHGKGFLEAVLEPILSWGGASVLADLRSGKVTMVCMLRHHCSATLATICNSSSTHRLFQSLLGSC